ncbi:hypothetical protein EQP59_05175 [Ornithobacterium rhinotracheale]|uniref:Uncharacterized protein n=1 Tax=Ornithobacterium rhinotracheale TaxID=28251 RepID=A0A410JRR7_ORNRH|nr:hypothetical protein [Ornithobacterium rhinotracheale]QAR30771.1 hypothetical protein EQP59_05175 [Ornithobacterium rhinotracheale]
MTEDIFKITQLVSEGTVTGGFNYRKGNFVQFKLDYLGLTLKIDGKLTVYKEKVKPSKKDINIKANIIERKDGILKTDKIFIL